MPESASSPLETYVAQQTRERLATVSQEIRRAADGGGQETVHDLRVSIRRLLSGMRAFREFFPRKKAGKIRRRLRRVMRAAGAVRDRDIAIELAAGAGLQPEARVAGRLAADRKRAVRQLRREIARCRPEQLSSVWPQRLRIES